MIFRMVLTSGQIFLTVLSQCTRFERQTDSRAVLSNGPAGHGPRAPKPQGPPNSPCVIFFISWNSDN